MKSRDLIIKTARRLDKFNLDELIVVSYLLSVDSSFNPKKISSELNLPLGDLMDMLEHLKELDIDNLYIVDSLDDMLKVSMYLYEMESIKNKIKKYTK